MTETLAASRRLVQEGKLLADRQQVGVVLARACRLEPCWSLTRAEASFPTVFSRSRPGSVAPVGLRSARGASQVVPTLWGDGAR